MTIPLPKLDTRTWRELVAEGRAQLPRASGAWTDFNYHDPGITLMELFAYIVEILIYRLDSLPPSAIRAFLAWAGVTSQPPRVATTVIALSSPAAGPVPGPIQVADARPGSTTVFEHAGGLWLSPAWIDVGAPVGSYRARLTTRYATVALDGQRVEASLEHTADNAAGSHPYLALGPHPAPGDSLSVALDQPPGAPGQVVNLFAFTAAFSSDSATRAALADEEAAAVAECAPVPEPCADRRPQPPAPAGPPAWWRHYSARTVWEYYAGGAGWKPLPGVEDETRGLSLSGGIRFQGPPDHAPGPGDPLFRIRCRLDSGGYECRPRLSRLLINAVAFEHASTPAQLPETVGVSDGHALQQFRLARWPVVAGTLQIRLTQGGLSDDGWSEVPDWDRSNPADKHYRLQPESGVVEFGNGRAGQVPPADAVISALAYRSGGGTDGNLPAGRLTRVVTPAGGLVAWHPVPASGGAPAETLDRARGRALDLMARPVRAVTAEDCEALALSTPGVPVARARALVGVHPDHPCIDAAGVVTVAVLPACGNPPTAGPDLLAAVSRFLERRRPITTELHVASPDYVQLSVKATLHVPAQARTDGLSAAAAARLDAFFDPLHGGPDGKGWPFGRRALEAEILALLAELPGVAFVDGVMFETAGVARCGCLDVCPMSLIASGGHQITVRRELSL